MTHSSRSGRRPRRGDARRRGRARRRVGPRHARARAAAGQGIARGSRVRSVLLVGRRGAPRAGAGPPAGLRAGVPRGGVTHRHPVAPCGSSPRRRAPPPERRLDPDGAGPHTGASVFPLVPRRRPLGLAFGAVEQFAARPRIRPRGSRPYAPGDLVQSIDWKTSARLATARASDEFVVPSAIRRSRPSRHRRGRPPTRHGPVRRRHALAQQAPCRRRRRRARRGECARARGLLGYVDCASAADGVGFWRAPRDQSHADEAHERVRTAPFDASPSSLDDAIVGLASSAATCPPAASCSSSRLLHAAAAGGASAARRAAGSWCRSSSRIRCGNRIHPSRRSSCRSRTPGRAGSTSSASRGRRSGNVAANRERLAALSASRDRGPDASCRVDGRSEQIPASSPTGTSGAESPTGGHGEEALRGWCRRPRSSPPSRCSSPSRGAARGGSAAAPRETFSPRGPRRHPAAHPRLRRDATALLEVTLPTGAYQPGPLRARGGFDPYVVVGEPRLVTRQVGDLTVALHDSHPLRGAGVPPRRRDEGVRVPGTPDDREARPGVSLSWRVPPPEGRRFADRRLDERRTFTRWPAVTVVRGVGEEDLGRHPMGSAAMASPEPTVSASPTCPSARCSAARRLLGSGGAARRHVVARPPAGRTPGRRRRRGAADAPRTGAPASRRRSTATGRSARGARDARRRAARRRRARPRRGDGAARLGRRPAARGRRRRARRVGALHERGPRDRPVHSDPPRLAARLRSGIPLVDAGSLRFAARRLRAASAGARGRARARARRGGRRRPSRTPVQHSSFFDAGEVGIVVVDFSTSIDQPGFRRITNVLRPVVQANQPVGIVLFSDVAHVALPAGTPGRELRPFLRYLRTERLLGQFATAGERERARQALLRENANPWLAAFRGGTRIRAARRRPQSGGSRRGQEPSSSSATSTTRPSTTPHSATSSRGTVARGSSCASCPCSRPRPTACSSGRRSGSRRSSAMPSSCATGARPRRARSSPRSPSRRLPGCRTARLFARTRPCADSVASAQEVPA